MAINKNESTKKVKLNLKGLSQSDKERAKELAGEIIVGEIGNFLDESKSPVQGGKFQKKKADGERSILFEFGDMRDAIKYEPLESDHVEIGIFEDAAQVERLKSFNHNTADTLPQRRFIAAPNQKFKKSIMDKVNKSIDRLKKDSEAEVKDLARMVLEDVAGSTFFDLDLGDIAPDIEIL